MAIGVSDDERDTIDLIIHEFAFFDQLVRAHAVAVVGGVDDNSIVAHAELFQMRADAADHIVE